MTAAQEKAIAENRREEIFIRAIARCRDESELRHYFPALCDLADGKGERTPLPIKEERAAVDFILYRRRKEQEAKRWTKRPHRDCSSRPKRQRKPRTGKRK